MTGHPVSSSSAEAHLFGAVVLAGGTAVRMDGVDKAALEVGGVTLLERALSAMSDAGEVVVVGDRVPTSRPVTWAREDPPSGGPAAGLLAGLDRFRRPPDLVAVLAVDMPRVTRDTFARLLTAVPGHDAAVLVDHSGRVQPLCGIYLREALQRVRPRDRNDEHGLAMHRLLRSLAVAEVAALEREAVDVDTWQDLEGLLGS